MSSARWMALLFRFIMLFLSGFLLGLWDRGFALAIPPLPRSRPEWSSILLCELEADISKKEEDFLEV